VAVILGVAVGLGVFVGVRVAVEVKVGAVVTVMVAVADGGNVAVDTGVPAPQAERTMVTTIQIDNFGFIFFSFAISE
jgi:hypothetical protein